ncbi:hypothetical protein BD414DRAFT_479342 [Trametes punicea]|nr:hypothetical protein BD414DRAFT_479342 [Trametes punicea]
MASSTDGADQVQQSLKEELPDATQAGVTATKEDVLDAHESSKPERPCAGEQSGGQPSPVPSSPASGVSTTKSGTHTSAAPGQSNVPPLSMPHPKKFSHVNINKKFLEKTSASTPGHVHATSPVTKTPTTTQKPVLQTSTSHPRLVTAKLTATPQPSTTTGPGWSRPASAVPSHAPTPLPAGSAKASPAPATPAGGAPLPPPVGKVIQPQPRSAQDPVPQRRDTANKPAWGATKVSTVNLPKLEGVQSDFPTAAEVAQGRVSKLAEKSDAPDAAAAHKQAVMAELQAEEDTFRGVHLDPNAHHWDEMEEDDDNFLGGVIEFEDGRQYKVQSAEVSQQAQSQQDSQAMASEGPEAPASSELTNEPVSKEERFVDDFDRSWPRSRPPHLAPGYNRDQRQEGFPKSPSTASQSPQLFNERSNRLEPYSHARHGPPGAPFNRRGSRSDHASSPNEPRRDAPPHTHLQGVQLLQKESQSDRHSFSRAPGGDRPLGPAHDGSRYRDRQPFQRDHGLWQTNGHQAPDRHPGPYGTSHPPRDASFDERPRRPPFEHPGLDHRRQLPPHLSTVAPRNPPSSRPEGPAQPQSTPAQREPPPPSTTSQADTSPATTDHALPAPTVPIVDLEEARKAAMHIAAERARLRRQQEEEEREKERERARRKAAEIEAKMKAMEEEKAREREKAEVHKRREDEVVGLIEDAVSSSTVENKAGAAEAPQRQPESRPALIRNVSSTGAARPFNTRRTSFTLSTQSTTSPSQPSPASETDSWRRKALPAVGAMPQTEPQKPSATPALAPPLLAHAELEVKAGEVVEVVDFSDHGKLVGSENKAHHLVHSATRPPRAVASDFFGDASTSPERTRLPHQPGDEDSWRRAPHTPVNGSVEPPVRDEAKKPSELFSQSPSALHHAVVVSGLQTTTGAHPPIHDDHSRRLSSHYQNGIQRPLAGSAYREAPMSALDDTLSRIKGALDGMHHAPEAPRPQKWVPPALRVRPAHSDLAPPQEVFDVTSTEPPASPKPAWNTFHVKLPHASHAARTPLETELVWPRGRRPFRLDAYSVRPPIDTFHRREATVTDVLFGRPRIVRGQPRYFVSIPRRRIPPRQSLAQSSVMPVVNLPSTPTRTRVPGLPRESAASSAASWRKAPSSSPTSLPAVRNEPREAAELDTVSRSPPPEVPSATSAVSSLPKASESIGPTPTTASTSSKSKPERKMPAGSDVAFYRNSRVETAVESQPPVKFIVSSELEGELEGQSDVQLPSMSQSVVSSSTDTAPPPESVQDQKSSAMFGAANGTITTTPPQPPSQPSLSPWMKSPKSFTIKESPARAPDPEHLKAVWSQTSDKAQIQPVNSLKGIADDLTGVPFSLQDVKSDDGETPPQSGLGTWSRMSSYEVTRAFQQVPSPSSSSSQRPGTTAPSSSTSTNGSTSRHPGFAMSPPPMGHSGLRQAYPAYSPMMSHSPGPTMMYSHPSPVPRHMVVNGTAPSYGQAVWMPAMHGTAPPPAGMVRSPYPPQLVSYPPPGAVPMYPTPMPMQGPPQQNGVQGRPPSMAMMSPVMQPAMSPMYAGSPVLVQTAPVMTSGQGYPMPSQPSRAPAPGRQYDQNSQSGTHMHPSPMRQPPQNGYNPVPSSYARPSW